MKGRILQRTREARTPSGLPLIGKIAVGEKTGKGYPCSLDYFISRGNYASYFEKAYPDKPQKIQIVFVSDNEMQSCFERWEARNKDGRLAAYSEDGEIYYVWEKTLEDYVSKTYQEVEAYVKQQRLSEYVNLTLQFIIPKIRGIIGVWKFQTKAEKSSMLSIVETFDTVKNNIGTVVNIPFDLEVKQAISQKPGSKSRFPVVNLIPNISTENLTILRMYLKEGMEFKQLGALITDETISEFAHPKALPTTVEPEPQPTFQAMPSPSADDSDIYEVKPEQKTDNGNKTNGGLTMLIAKGDASITRLGTKQAKDFWTPKRASTSVAVVSAAVNYLSNLEKDLLATAGQPSEDDLKQMQDVVFGVFGANSAQGKQFVEAKNAKDWQQCQELAAQAETVT